MIDNILLILINFPFSTEHKNDNKKKKKIEKIQKKFEIKNKKLTWGLGIFIIYLMYLNNI